MSQSNTPQPHPQTTTQTQTQTQAQTLAPILHLRGPRERKPEVRWADGTIDNEHMNKKKTKICCIFHPADGDESCESSESSESDDSDVSDSEQNGPNAYEVQPKYQNQSQVPS